MIFGKRKKATEPGAAGERDVATARSTGGTSGSGEMAESGRSAPDPIPADRALDFIAEMLRTFGENAFDVGPIRSTEVSELFEGWARHLLVGTPAPGREATDKGEAPTRADAASGARRDLPGLRRVFRDHRVSEAEYVTTSLGEFREATWAFIGGLRRSLSAEQTADRRISHRMRRLEGAVRSGDPVKIKTEA